MHYRSWMAAVVLVAGSIALLSGMASSQKTGTEQSPPPAGNPSTSAPKTHNPPNSGDRENFQDPADRSSS